MGESEPLLESRSRAAVWYNFTLFAILFSITHGVETATLAFSAAFIGKEAAGAGNGVLYYSYGATALFLAVATLRCLGALRVTFIGLMCTCAYTLAYLILIHCDSGTGSGGLAVVVVGSVVGGVGSGLLWPAQGAFFAGSVRVAAACQGPTIAERREATAHFAGRFAGIYLGFEFVFKIGASLLLIYGGPSITAANTTLLVTYFIAAAVAALLLILFISDVPSPPDASTAPSDGAGAPRPCGDSLAALTLLYDEPVARLLAPYTIAFGLEVALYTGILNSELVGVVFGSGYIGFLTGATVLVGALCSFAIPKVGISKGGVLAVGAGAYVLSSVIVAVLLSLDDLAAASAGAYRGWLYFLVVLVYALAGVGRAVFESSNRGLALDVLPERSTAAFANIVLQNALATGTALIVFPYLPYGWSVGVTMAVSAVAIPCSLRAESHAMRGAGGGGRAAEPEDGAAPAPKA